MSADMNKIRVEINKRMGSMEEYFVWVEKGKSLQLEGEGIRRALVQSTTITLGKLKNYLTIH